jgi:hypothetical protein
VAVALTPVVSDSLSAKAASSSPSPSPSRPTTRSHARCVVATLLISAHTAATATLLPAKNACTPSGDTPKSKCFGSDLLLAPFSFSSARPYACAYTRFDDGAIAVSSFFRFIAAASPLRLNSANSSAVCARSSGVVTGGDVDSVVAVVV